MKLNLIPVGVSLIVLSLSGCANLGDDAFAHSVKSGDSRGALATMQPGQARLHIHEVDGNWYYPIHYTIVRGDAESTFALLQNGSPSTLDGRSLAYNAARVNQISLAHDLAKSGYGSQSDIADATAANRRDQEIDRQNTAAASMAVLGLFALMANSSPSEPDSDLHKQFQEFETQRMRDQSLANQHGL